MDGFTAAVVAWNELSWHEFFWGEQWNWQADLHWVSSNSDQMKDFCDLRMKRNLISNYQIHKFIILWCFFWEDLGRCPSFFFLFSFCMACNGIRESLSRWGPEFWPVAGEGAGCEKKFRCWFWGNKKLRNWNEHKNGRRSYLWTCQTRATIATGHPGTDSEHSKFNWVTHNGFLFCSEPALVKFLDVFDVHFLLQSWLAIYIPNLCNLLPGRKDSTSSPWQDTSTNYCQ